MPEYELIDLHAQIMLTAKRLFIQYGYHGLAMRQIAESLGVSKAALYYHFRDKEELLLAILLEYLDGIEAVLDEVIAGTSSSRERIRQFVARLLAQPADQRAVVRLASQVMDQLSPPRRAALEKAYHEKFLMKIQGIIRNGVEQGELRRVDPNVATWALLGMLYPYYFPVHASQMPSSDQVLEPLLAIYLEGLNL
jgi:AcrR family transcriptional regulator